MFDAPKFGMQQQQSASCKFLVCLGFVAAFEPEQRKRSMGDIAALSATLAAQGGAMRTLNTLKNKVSQQLAAIHPLAANFILGSGKDLLKSRASGDEDDAEEGEGEAVYDADTQKTLSRIGKKAVVQSLLSSPSFTTSLKLSAKKSTRLNWEKIKTATVKIPLKGRGSGKGGAAGNLVNKRLVDVVVQVRFYYALTLPS